MHLSLTLYPLHDCLWGTNLWAVRWSTSAGRPAPLTSANRPEERSWSCASVDQRKATSANRPGVRRWTGAGVCACRSAPKPKCACALVLRWSTSAQSNFLARFQNDLTSLMASIYMLS